MSDIDRLLEAAEWLDKRGHRGEEPDRASESWAEAALLRAVADEHQMGKVVGDGKGGWTMVTHPLWAAASALADTILGVGDE